MIILDGRRMTTREEAHAHIREMLSLPEYYGLNADALNDCLGEKSEKVSLWILDPGKDEVAAAVRTVSEVIRDNGGAVKEL